MPSYEVELTATARATVWIEDDVDMTEEDARDTAVADGFDKTDISELTDFEVSSVKLIK